MKFTGCCRGDNPNRDDLLWQLLVQLSAQKLVAFSGHRQLRTDLTLQPLERCVEGLSLWADQVLSVV